VNEPTCARETHTWRGRERVCTSERQSVEARTSAKGRKRERHTRCKSEENSARARKSASKREKLVSFDTRRGEIFMKIRLFYHTAAPERQQTYTHTYIPTYIQTYTHTCIYTFKHTCMHQISAPERQQTCIHTNIRAYIHTDILKYTHTCTYTYMLCTCIHTTHIHATHRSS